MGHLKFSLTVAGLLFVFGVFSGFIIHHEASFAYDNHFVLHAESLIEGDLFLNPLHLPTGDYVDYFGKQYLFFGPAPSILLIPFVAFFGVDFPQTLLSISSLVLIYAGIFLISRKLKFSKVDSLWLSNFFVFGTVLYFVSLVNISAYLVQALGTAFVVLAIVEYFIKKRWLLIGLFIAAAGASRITLFGSAIFFIFELIRNRHERNFTRNLALFIFPIVVAIGLLGLYNFRRFHSFFDTGYTRNVSALDKDWYNYKLGWFDPIHISTNLYSLLLMAPEPITVDNVEFVLKFPYLKANKFGMAIWFTSPLFIYVFMAKWRNLTRSSFAALVVLVIPSLLYWGIGAVQFGYRYSLDFLPFLYLILLSAFKAGLPKMAKLLITIGIIFNCFYMLSLWNSYPVFEFFRDLF